VSDQVKGLFELFSVFLQCSVQAYNDSFTIAAHPDVGEGAKPEAVRCFGLFYVFSVAGSAAPDEYDGA